MLPTTTHFDDIWQPAALMRAFGRARRAKRGKGGEPAFYFELERNIAALSDALRERTWRPDPYRYFIVRHTKERRVAEATFRDRVVQRVGAANHIRRPLLRRSPPAPGPSARKPTTPASLTPPDRHVKRSLVPEFA